jgi:filamentous hemagglutinin family protein
MSRKTLQHHNPRLLATAVAACFATAPAWSLPTAPTVVNGAASFNQAGNVLSVTNSNNAIINWQKFGIAAGEVTKFIQASASSSVLNRVVGGNLSAIYGSLQSNGRVWLVNPAGILVGPGATIDTAAFVASTLTMRDADFLAGKLTFSGPGGNVINQGTITTPAGGSVYLIGANVSNEGIINTPKGEVILASGQTVNLVDTATPGLKVEITGAAGNTTNLGTIAAEAGRIGMAGVIVRNSGTLNASSAVEEGGKVFLKASQDTYVDKTGRIVATGTKGGRVEVLGNRVAVMDSASIDASGTNGGGVVLVGGDFQGNNPDVQNSQIAYFGPNASIKANAENVGDGGKVIVWADDTTRAYGNIQARGGDNSGNGGFVETSGKRYLDFNARVDTRAPKGNNGTLLLDPSDILIGASDSYYGGSFDGSNVFSGSTSDQTQISWGIIDSLLYSNDVVVTTTGSGGSGSIGFGNNGYLYQTNDLRLLAHGEIYTNGFSVTHYGGGGLLLVAGWNGASTGADAAPAPGFSSIVSGGSFYLAGGYFTARAANNISIGNIDTSGTPSHHHAGDVTLVSLGGSVQTGSITANGYSTCGECGAPGRGGDVTITALAGSIDTGNITAVGGSAMGYGTPSANGGDVTLTAGYGIWVGNIDVSGGSGGSGYSGNPGYPGSDGGDGGNVRLEAGSDIYANWIVTRGGDGGTGGGGYYAAIGDSTGGIGGKGGKGGNITLATGNGGGYSYILLNEPISTTGGNGGNGGNGGYAPYGASIAGGGGKGGDAGRISITSSSGSVFGYYGLTGVGGNGGNAGIPGSGLSQVYGALGDGGRGADITIEAATGIAIATTDTVPSTFWPMADVAAMAPATASAAAAATGVSSR